MKKPQIDLDNAEQRTDVKFDNTQPSHAVEAAPPRRYGTLTRIVGLTLKPRCQCAVGSFAGYGALTVAAVDALAVGFESGRSTMPLWQAIDPSAGCRVYVHKETDTALVGDGLLAV